jgi:anti-anti-sigma regulatory factor
MRSHTIRPDTEASLRHIARALTDGETAGLRLVLDLGGTRAVTAAGLGQLVRLHNRLRATGGSLVVRNVGRSAYAAFAATRLTDLLDVRRAGEASPAA